MPEIDAGAIADRRQAALAELERLIVAQGAAKLDGAKFDAGAIMKARIEIEALESAEAEATRRGRAAAAKAEAERIAAVRRQIATAEAGRLAAIAAAEKAARTCAAEMGRAMALAGEICVHAKTIGQRPPLALARSAIEARLSDRLALLLRGIASTGGAFGNVDLRSPPFGWRVSDAWPEHERALAGAELAALTAPSTPKEAP
jgi:hypothetical protein